MYAIRSYYDLLTYISGLGPQLAQNIVDFRKENGAFGSRKELMKVPRMGAKAFEQAAGFLRIPDAENPLDNSAVHPESYAVVQKMAKDLKCSVADLVYLRIMYAIRSYYDTYVGVDAGFRLKLAFFSLFGSVAKTDYVSYNAGLSFGFR